MKNFIKILVHLLVWCIVLLVPIYIMSKQGILDSGPYVFSYLVRTAVFAVLFYVNYLFLIDKFLFRKQFVSFIAVNIILIVALLLCQTLALDAFILHHHPGPPDKEMMDASDMRKGPKPPFAMKIFTDYVLVILVLGLSVAIRMTVRWYDDNIKYEQIKNSHLEADLRSLRSQLNPHLLFNTLNNIYSLIAIDQTKAQDSVHRLSNILRYILYENEAKFVSVKKELEFTRNYIDLMKLRLGSSVKLNVLVENSDSSDVVASLMFITLIENAFKHGLNRVGDSFIDIKILVEDGIGVLCTVENSLPDNESNIERSNSGIGLINLSKRLELIYPNNYQFITECREKSFFALLRINFA